MNVAPIERADLRQACDKAVDAMDAPAADADTQSDHAEIRDA
jgi:hypothetical protein